MIIPVLNSYPARMLLLAYRAAQTREGRRAWVRVVEPSPNVTLAKVSQPCLFNHVSANVVGGRLMPVISALVRNAPGTGNQTRRRSLRQRGDESDPHAART